MSLCRQKSSPDRQIVSHIRVNDDANISDTYTLGRLLGQGSFGKVYEAVNNKTGMKWAIKSINKEKAGSAAMKLVEREVAILKMVKHDHIIHLNEVLETPRKMYLIMEICFGGELADELKKRRCLDEAIVRQIMSNVASAISYLHKNDIVHRDLKLENILLHNNPELEGEDWDIKVTDFGLSIVKGSTGLGQDNMMQAFCGTPIYMSPEILDNKTYSRQCDIWALGVLMYILFSGYPPFNATDDEKLSELIRKAEVDFSDDVWTNVSPEAKSCILEMLTIDPAHRLTAAELCEHKFITGKSKGTTNVLEMMKQYNYEMRNGSAADKELNGNDGIDGATNVPAVLLEAPSGSCIKESVSGDSTAARPVEQMHTTTSQTRRATGSASSDKDKNKPECSSKSQSSSVNNKPTSARSTLLSKSRTSAMGSTSSRTSTANRVTAVTSRTNARSVKKK